MTRAPVCQAGHDPEEYETTRSALSQQTLEPSLMLPSELSQLPDPFPVL